MDKYVRKIITASRNHLKPIQGETIRKEGIKWLPLRGRHDCRDTYSILLSIPLSAIELIFLATFVCKTLAE